MYTFNENYFEDINCADKAYLLGFICTDGNIYKKDINHQTQIQISIKDCDIEILNHFKRSLNSNHPIKNQIDKRRPTTIMNTITFISDKMGKDLFRFNITSNKTFNLNYTTIFNLIDKSLWNSFLLGLFDGDGNISCPKDGTISGSHVRLSGPIEQLQQIQVKLNNISLYPKIFQDNRKYTKPFGSLECVGTISKYCLLKYLYSSNVESLIRKKNSALELMSRIENNVTNRKENIEAVKTWEIFNKDKDKIK